jgi:hypothetical protein
MRDGEGTLPAAAARAQIGSAGALGRGSEVTGLRGLWRSSSCSLRGFEWTSTFSRGDGLEGMQSVRIVIATSQRMSKDTRLSTGYGDAAIQKSRAPDVLLDCFAAVAMTTMVRPDCAKLADVNTGSSPP